MIAVDATAIIMASITMITALLYAVLYCLTLTLRLALFVIMDSRFTLSSVPM